MAVHLRADRGAGGSGAGWPLGLPRPPSQIGGGDRRLLRRAETSVASEPLVALSVKGADSRRLLGLREQVAPAAPATPAAQGGHAPSKALRSLPTERVTDRGRAASASMAAAAISTAFTHSRRWRAHARS